MSDTKTLQLFDPSKELTVFKIDELDKMISDMNAHADAFVGDPTTAKGRAEIKSEAYKFSTLKSRVIKLAKEACEDAKRVVDTTTTARIKFEQAADANRDKVRAPAIKWEREEEERVDKLKAKIARIRHYRSEYHGLDIAQLTAEISLLESLNINESTMQEYESDAKRERDEVVEVLKARVAALEENAKRDAELKRLQEAEAKRIEEQAAKAAEDARKAKELKDAQEAKERAEREAKEAEEREARRKEEEARRIKEAEERAKQQERERIEREHAAKEQAYRDEQKRIADEERKQREIEEAKSANEKHRATVRKTVAESIRDLALIDIDSAVIIIQLIEQGKIPHTTIKF